MSLLGNPGIVRNRLKIDSAIQNASGLSCNCKDEFGSFDAYIWQFVGGQPRQNGWHTPQQVPAQTPQSDAMSKDLKRRGFNFVGSTICYAFMQAVGMVNDHAVNCFRHAELTPRKLNPRKFAPEYPANAPPMSRRHDDLPVKPVPRSP